MPYNKPYLPIVDQIALIRSRGMAVGDLGKADQILRKIGYQRLSGYWYPFRRMMNVGGVSAVSDYFKPGTDLSTIVDLYIFDKKLRLLFLDAFERIEIAPRLSICLTLGAYAPNAHWDPALLHGNFARRTNPRTGRVEQQEWLRRTDEKFVDSKEDFAKHFRTKYPGEHPPIWIACEVWDYGSMSYLFSGLQNKDQVGIAAEYNLAFDVLESWIRTINVARNVWAHHSRLWNRPIPNQPKWPTAVASPELAHIGKNTRALTRTYDLACLTRYFLRRTSSGTDWHNRFINLCQSFPNTPLISLAAAGWQQESTWN